MGRDACIHITGYRTLLMEQRQSEFCEGALYCANPATHKFLSDTSVCSRNYNLNRQRTFSDPNGLSERACDSIFHRTHLQRQLVLPQTTVVAAPPKPLQALLLPAITSLN